MEEILRHLTNHPDVTISVQTGIPDWRSGEILLSIHSNGTIKVRNQRSSGEKTYEGTLDQAEIQAVGEEFADHNFTGIKSLKTTRLPGDEPVILRIERGTERLYEASLWHGDRYEDDNLDHILERSDELVSQVTNGALPF